MTVFRVVVSFAPSTSMAGLAGNGSMKVTDPLAIGRVESARLGDQG